jgi:hypothetical protein
VGRNAKQTKPRRGNRKHGSYLLTDLLTHIVFSTKDRAPMLDGELKPRLFAYMGGIIVNLAAMSC